MNLQRSASRTRHKKQMWEIIIHREGIEMESVIWIYITGAGRFRHENERDRQDSWLWAKSSREMERHLFCWLLRDMTKGKKLIVVLP